MTDGLSRTCARSSSGAYDCLDRIVLNAYCRFAQNPGGFCVWWRQITGDQTKLDNAHLSRMSGRFHRRLRSWAMANRVPVRRCRPGEHKHEIAGQYLAKADVQGGLFLILVGRAQAPVFKVLNSGTSRENSRTRMSITSPSISWTASGDTSQCRSDGQ